jgi:CDP-diacylglycerol--serine O-phosphatidyltransferase
VSFGVAPGMLIYNTIAHHSLSPWVAFVAVLIPVMGELRLARFNIDDRQTTSFLGMPIPANALFWIGTCAAINKYGYPGDATMIVGIIVMSLLMVTTPLKMFSLKFKNFNLGENLRRYQILLAAIIFLAIDGVSGLTWTILFYVFLSLVPAKADK